MHGFAMVSLNYPRYLQQGQILKVNDTVRHTSRKAVIVNKSGQARSPFTACRSLDALKRQSMRKKIRARIIILILLPCFMLFDRPPRGSAGLA
jgi:hypothetical protein